MHFLTVGTDARLMTAAGVLRGAGHTVRPYDGTVAFMTDAILLPVPVSKDGTFITGSPLTLTGFFASVPPEVPLWGGAYRGRTVDLTARDDFALLNAIPTAEGALALAIRHTDRTLFDSRVLVTGFGRVARILCDRLKGLCPHITVAARNPSAIAEAQALSYHTVRTEQLSTVLADTDLVFNTVPAPLFDLSQLPAIRPDTVFIELASRNAGFTPEAMERLKVISAPGLPGDYSPKTAGEILAQTILNVISEST